jgi:hypothetical protein
MIAISDIGNRDRLLYAAPTEPDGSFQVSIPSGTYVITWFDITQLHILQTMTFTIPEPTNVTNDYALDTLYLTGWYTELQGFFFNDTNEDGIMDEGENGLAHGPFPVLRLRDSTQIDRGVQFEVPFSDSERLRFYSILHAYPLGSWLTLHAWHPLYEMTGYTFRTEAQLTNTTVTANSTTAEVGISIFGSPGIRTTLDIGFKLKDAGTGTIIGGVYYDTTRTNLDASSAMLENHEPGIPGIEVQLYKMADLELNDQNCSGACVLTNVISNATEIGYTCAGEDLQSEISGDICTRYWVGAEGKTKPSPIVLYADSVTGELDLNDTVSGMPEPNMTTFTAEYDVPKGCKIIDEKGNHIPFGDGQRVLPDGDQMKCIETPLLRNQVGSFAQTDGTYQFHNLEPGFYAVKVIIPIDKSGTKDAYKLRTENDINTYESDEWIGTVSETFSGFNPPVCPSNATECPYMIDDGPPQPPTIQNIKDPCAGAYITVHTLDKMMSHNPTFALNGGSHAAGNMTHKCDIKIVRVEPDVNSLVNFHLFTDVSAFSSLFVESQSLSLFLT